MDIKKIIVTEDERFERNSTSKGNQKKWIKNNIYIKSDSLGYESVAEFVSSIFLSNITNLNYDFVFYKMCFIEENGNEYYGCYSENFLKNEEELFSFYRILKSFYKNIDDLLREKNGKELLVFITNTMKKITSIDIEEYARKICYIDAILLNEDRHLNNICLIKDQNHLKESFIFDNGLSLLSDEMYYPFNYKTTIHMKNVKSKTFSSSFKQQVSFFDNKNMLIIDEKKLNLELEKAKKELIFKEKEFERAVFVLLKRLEETEGILWKKK